ncbi:MAG: NAD(P)H-dependent oxidoreductase subunit E [Planctomycetota bacterium]
MKGDAKNPKFSEAAMKEFNELLTRYPDTQAPLLMVLHIAEREFGWLSEEVQHYVAGLLKLPASHVAGVVTFYTMYKRSPHGPKSIQWCSTLPCALRGSEQVYDHIAQCLGIKNGGTSADGLVTVRKVECLGACDKAPVMLVNEDLEVEVDEKKFDALHAAWRKENARA